MANSAGDSLDIPVYGGHYLVTFPILDNTGSPVTSASGLDSEVSIDLGTFTDCANEAVELATSSGIYYLYLTGSEMTGKIITIRIKTSTTDAKTTILSIHPVRMPSIDTGTAQAGAAGTITLKNGSSTADSYYNGMYVQITNNSPANVQYQTRKIISYVGSTRVATVESNWGTNPSSASTYTILCPTAASMNAIAGVGVSGPTTAGILDSNMVSIVGSSTAATNQKNAALAVFSGTITGAATVTTLIDSSLTQATTNHWVNRTVIFLTGAAALQASLITGFVPASDQLVFSALSVSPSATDTYIIV